ncbi:hypothetical protein JB92DRAFT_3104902 [Gautieria morchelliformis]|nr:hypothetical protein JB92DRAFT_3104902 [Gautieria morchelliformis]
MSSLPLATMADDWDGGALIDELLKRVAVTVAQAAAVIAVSDRCHNIDELIIRAAATAAQVAAFIAVVFLVRGHVTQSTNIVV